MCLKRTFPTSTIVWRTYSFPYQLYEHGIFRRSSPSCVAAVNQAARRIAPAYGVYVLDLATALTSPATYHDGIHFDLTSTSAHDQIKSIWTLIIAFLALAGHQLKDIDERALNFGQVR